MTVTSADCYHDRILLLKRIRRYASLGVAVILMILNVKECFTGQYFYGFQRPVIIDNSNGRAEVRLVGWGRRVPFRKHCYIELYKNELEFQSNDQIWNVEGIAEPSTYVVTSDLDDTQYFKKVNWMGGSFRWMDDGLSMTCDEVSDINWGRIYIGEHYDVIALMRILALESMVPITGGIFVWLVGFIVIYRVRLNLTTLQYHCPRCGYCLRGLYEYSCPECGWNREDKCKEDEEQ